VPQVVEFHDLNFEHFPGDMPKIHLWHYKKFFPKFARKAKRIVTVSEFSKQDIVDCYQVNPDKIDVAYNGVNEIFKPLSEAEQKIVRAHYSFGHPYFMFVGSLHPRKNLARLFTAFDKFKKRSHNDVKLVIVGEKRWWTEPIQRAYDAMSCKEDVVFAGRLSAEDLHRVTAAALASVYVSYFEGFGIPILEAFKCDTPVITSNVTSMPEVAQDAALLVDPFNEDDIADAMVKVLDEDVRKTLVEKGRKRAEDFSWNQAAEVIWNSLMKSI
jgi:glycosyltransferase involved in cell wall biosynthesis